MARKNVDSEKIVTVDYLHQLQILYSSVPLNPKPDFLLSTSWFFQFLHKNSYFKPI